MVATELMYLIFAYGIPLEILYILLMLALFGGDPVPGSHSSFYVILLFAAITDVFTWLISIMTYRLVLFKPFDDFFHEYETDWTTSLIYGGTFLLCSARDFSLVALALNRLTSMLYNVKTWAPRSIALIFILCPLIGIACSFFNFDTNVEYQRVPMGNGSYIYFMLLDESNREWLKEPSVILGWTGFTYAAMLVIYLCIGFHLLFGGIHPETERREYKLTMIAFFIFCANTGFLGNQIMGYLIDRDDMVEALKAVREGAPLIPYVFDARIFVVPLCMFVLDSDIRRKMLGMIGMGGKLDSGNSVA